MVVEVHLPIFYYDVLRPGIKTPIFSGLTGDSHYHQVSTGLHTIPQMHIVTERHVQWVGILTLRRGK